MDGLIHESLCSFFGILLFRKYDIGKNSVVLAETRHAGLFTDLVEGREVALLAILTVVIAVQSSVYLIFTSLRIARVETGGVLALNSILRIPCHIPLFLSSPSVLLPLSLCPFFL